jgi:hypothetical protein
MNRDCYRVLGVRAETTERHTCDRRSASYCQIIGKWPAASFRRGAEWSCLGI